MNSDPNDDRNNDPNDDRNNNSYYSTNSERTGSKSNDLNNPAKNNLDSNMANSQYHSRFNNQYDSMNLNLIDIAGGIIDIHAHIFSDKLAAKAVKFIGDHYQIPMHGQGLLEELRESAITSGVSQVVILSSATKPSQTESVNRWLSAKQDERFTAFGTLHPDSDCLEADLELILKLGLKGIKLHPEFQSFSIDDKKMDAIYRLVEGRLPILMHVGDPITDLSSPIRLLRVIHRFPELQIIAAHLGGYERWEEAKECLIGLPIYIDTSSALWAMEPEEAIEIIRMHGVERVLFGTDYPVNTHAQELELFNRLQLSSVERQLILHDNAAKILMFV